MPVAWASTAVANGRFLSGLDRWRRTRPALGLGELKLAGQVMPHVRKIVYNSHQTVIRLKLALGIADVGFRRTVRLSIPKDLKAGC